MATAQQIKKILAAKSAKIDELQTRLEIVLIDLGEKFARDLGRIVGAGDFDPASIAAKLEALGHEAEIIAALDGFEEVIRFSQRFMQAAGLPFLLTRQNEAQLAAFMGSSAQRITRRFRREIVEDMTEFAIASRLSGRPARQIIDEARERLADTGRRAGTEVGTALSQFDRAALQMAYENAGVERYVYFPPTIIETSRDSCRAAVADDKQRSGWTLADINASPDLDFVRGGRPYYNCRHEWIPHGIAG